MSDFSVSFDQRSLSAIAQFAGFQILLSPEVQAAMKQGGETLVNAMRAQMNWKDGTGMLAESLHVLVESPYEIQVGSSLPYAARRNWGFTGRVDSLGRYFADDPGAYFAERGMEQASNQILHPIDSAVDQLLARFGEGY